MAYVKAFVKDRKLTQGRSEIIFACVSESCVAIKENPPLTVQSFTVPLPGSGLTVSPGASPSNRLSLMLGALGLCQMIRHLSAERETLIADF